MLAALFSFIVFVRNKKRLTVLVLALMVGASAMSLRQASIQNSAIHKYFDQKIEFIAQVKTDPSKTSSGNYSFAARLLHFTADGHVFSVRTPIRIISKNEVSVLPGQEVSGTARAIKTQESRVAALLIVDQETTTITPASTWEAALGAIRQGLRDNSGEGDAGALIPGMVLGDTSKQSPKFKEAMKRSGLTHLVAVSGANFAIVSSFVLWCMQFLIKRKSARVVATAAALMCFIALVRPSPSVLRAAAMAAVLLTAQLGKRASDSLPALGFAICAVVLGDPWQARDAGFALSVLATAGLLLLAPVIQERIPTHKKLAGALAPPIAAMIFCAPILVSLSGYLSPMSIVANLLAAPAVAPITVLGFIAALASPFAPWITQVIIFGIRFPAGFITSVANWVASFPVLTIHNGAIGFALVAMILGFLVLFKRKWKQNTAILLLIILTLTWFQRWPVGSWQVAQCDVGQGDSLVINLQEHRAVVIDVGPDPILEDKCLRQLGITEVPLLILSHFHADHVGGLSGLLKGRKVSQVWISNNREPQIESTLAMSALNASEIVTAQQGLIADVGQVKIEVLWPEANLRNFEELPGEGSAINNSSIAIVATTTNWSLFAAGDLEPPAQHELISRVGEVDIYKVCHHGSKYQDEGLMRALSAQIALISVGAGNPYGHPAPESIASLTRLGTQVLRTDRDGAIAITAVAHHLRVRKRKGRVKLFYWS
ncbi:MAG: MBL fold metallo-hydrolase [Candidatus Planktophila sp.]|nr:MBL fold metallo-hydrolase [Candidatus Planktophila sp.]